MAEHTGVTSSEPRPNASGGGGGGGGGSFFKRNKKAVYLVGGGAAFLMLAHKGSRGGGASDGSQGLTSDPSAQLAAQENAAGLAATDQQLSAFPFPGGVAPTTIEGDNSSVTYPASSSTVNLPAGTSAGGSPNASPALTDTDASLDSQVVAQDKAVVSADKKVTGRKPAPHQPPKHTKPKPTKKSGEVHHPSEGAHVQAHSGATAHGRTFPGARSVHVGGARTVNGNVYQDVTVDYGGHSETHTSVNGGKQWINNKKGANPPQRGPQHTITPAGHANPPRRPAPARKQAARR